VVVDETGGANTLITKHVSTNRDVILTQNNVSTGWRVYEHCVIVAGRVSSIKIAIPAVNDTLDIQAFVPVFQKTFAFLPLKSHRFKFGMSFLFTFNNKYCMLTLMSHRREKTLITTLTTTNN